MRLVGFLAQARVLRVCNLVLGGNRASPSSADGAAGSGVGAPSGPGTAHDPFFLKREAPVRCGASSKRYSGQPEPPPLNLFWVQVDRWRNTSA